MDFVIYEERDWHQSESVFYIPRSKRYLFTQKYKSAIVQDLSKINLVLDGEINQLLQDVIEELIKLDMIMQNESFALPTLLLRTEALSSSQIENYNSSNKNVALAQLNSSNKSQAKIISSNLNAMIHALNLRDNIDLDLIKSIHYELLEDSGKGSPGNIRELPNWIGESSISPHEADYVPPHPDYLPKNLDDFIIFINRNDIHPFVMSAFAHAY
ncbi:MAG: Fic family protein, partial [Sphaerochaetaceae bacterium]|nr:Fic family protein [Sphaerochaetaceae bacterium]